MADEQPLNGRDADGDAQQEELGAKDAGAHIHLVGVQAVEEPVGQALLVVGGH